DLAQRLLQVVRGDVGELLQLGVGALQLVRLMVELLVRDLDRLQLVEDPPAHHVDVVGELDDVARPLARDRLVAVAARGAARAAPRSGRLTVRRSAITTPTMPASISTAIEMNVPVRKVAALVRSVRPASRTRVASACSLLSAVRTSSKRRRPMFASGLLAASG